ncbi:MAG: sterol desaturase family protein [Leptolyngbya sp. IPPAS B-1204]|nr:sterol desaturase family protein [Elainella sp. C42_A2020_010]RNJ65506.1 MAG: sterol desaturase family protein [Leptolyngbya sp. IPPAS B-1204]
MLESSLGFLKYLLTAFLLYGIFIVVERICPAEPHQPFRKILFNLQWYVLYSVVSLGMIQLGLNLVVPTLQQWLGAPLWHIPAPKNIWGYGLAVLAYFLATDFFYYWFHRAQHQIPLLWEQHKFHHSDTALNVTSTRRVHWLEDPLVILFVALPIGLLLRFDGLELGILAFVEILWLQFIHMNLRLELSWLGRIIVGPQHHRLHHSFLREHLDRNFAVFFPVWDMVFGTYYKPRRHEFPATGLASGETYDQLWIGFILPLREWFGPGYLGRFFKGHCPERRN